ncbi:hypothetical protein DWV00_16560 [Trinickia dinghuensis]|uniref:Uncharacterized protein n=1 Tax=Trinickia dinghuensis TaxID=2291023 RepID=A0A3D8JYQ3_9BURK|nr:hypothetical protein DWV00_16560 [Trinickia dinghuensis]
MAGCGSGDGSSPSAAAVSQAMKVSAAAAPVNTSSIYMSSNEPAPTSADQGTIANGFNAAVNEASKLALTDANYSWLYNRFDWAAATSADCSQSGMDSGGGGYFASLAGRCAYYSRDYAHYLIGAYYMGYDSQNLNMAQKFSTVIDTTDPSHPIPWWAFGVNGKPYERRAEQPAVFEIGDSILTLYKMTGDPSYKNMASYINGEVNSTYWNAQDSNGNHFWNPDGFRVTNSPGNDPATYNEFAYDPTESNIIWPGYDIFLGGDSAASQIAYFCKLASYPQFLSDPSTASTYTARCNTLRSNFNTNWWESSANRFYVAQVGLANDTYTTQAAPNGTSMPASNLTYLDGYAEEPNFFPLYKNVITDWQKVAAQADYVNNSAEYKYDNNNDNYTPGIESFTYLPTSFFNVSDGSTNRYDYAWKWMRRLAQTQYANASNSSDGIASTYPEVPFVLIADSVTKVMGLDFDGIQNAFSTLPRFPSDFTTSNYIAVHNVPLYSNASGSSYNLPVDITAQKVDNGSGYAIQLAFNGVKPWQITGSSASLTWTPKFSAAIGASGCAIQTTYDNGSVSQSTYGISNASGYYACTDTSGNVVTVSIPLGSSAAQHIAKIVAMTYSNAAAVTSILTSGLPASQ